MAVAARPLLLDIVISFDVTGSMMPVLNAVRENLEQLTATIFAAEVGAGERGVDSSTRMMIFAHGDYDAEPYQVTSTPGFTSDPAEVAAFIRGVGSVRNSWNEGENYEVVLDRCCSLDWRPGARKLLILVGDDIPHPPHFPENREWLDWRASARRLAEMDIRCFAVQCASGGVERARGFYKELAAFHRLGRYLLLSQFYMMSELVLGIFHAASDDMEALRVHEAELRRTGRHNRSMAQAFATLRGEELRSEDPPSCCLPHRASSLPSSADPSVMIPVAEGRFQMMPVAAEVVIKPFVEAAGARFKAGRGFYELTKAESVALAKEVVLERRATGEFFTGDAVRTLLKLDPSRPTTRISPTAAAHRDIFAEYRIFVQSNSYNRKLVPGTMFLYEVDAQS